MKELHKHVEQLQCENDRLRAQVEERRDLNERDAQDSGQAKHQVIRDKRKKPIAFDDVETPSGDELSSESFPNPSLAKSRSNKDRPHQRHSHCPVFSNSNGGTFRQATSRGQNQLSEAPRNVFTLPTGIMPMQPIYPVFGAGPSHTLYMPPTAMIRGPNDILSSPLGRHILDYEAARGCIMPTLAMFDASRDPYDHMLHYNRTMTRNAGNDQLLCKVFPASLQGPVLAWFHRLPIQFSEFFW